MHSSTSYFISTVRTIQMKMLNPCICCKRFVKEFKTFILQGNVFDLAVGIIIGTAFSNVVKSLVEDILTPPFGLLIGGVDFINLTIRMNNFVYTDQPPVVIRYGKFIEEILALVIMGFVLFFIVKAMNKVKLIALRNGFEEENQKKNELSAEGKVLLEIRDILSKQIDLKNTIFL